MTFVPPDIFRAYDIRGLVGQSLTTEVAHLVGRAFGSEAARRRVRTVVVGRDGRPSSQTLTAALTRGLRESGRNVIDVGEVPTPVVYFAAHHLHSRSCIVVTGSHNPPQYNGLKMVLGGKTLHSEYIQHLRARIEDDYFVGGCGNLRHADILDSYVERITDDVRLARPLRVALDCGNGVGGVVGPRLLRALGCEVTELYCDVDGRFPHHHPNPSVPANLEALIETVRRDGLDLGLALDGDGDRLGVVDGNGYIIQPDRQMMMFVADVLRRQPRARILYDIKCSRRLAEVIAAHGGRPVMWKSGHSLMKAKLAESHAQLAGELSGHIFFKDRWYGFDDGLYTAARLLELLSRDSRPPAEIFAELPDSLNTPEMTIPLAREGVQFAFMDQFMAQAHFPEAQLNAIDGLRVEFKDGWGLVRASNTTPSLVIRFEGDNPEALTRIQSLFRSQLLQIDPELALPF